jgi:hypothetical protein
MLAPDRVERSVPEPTASRDRRPGSRPSHLSSASIMFIAMPDRKSTSPIRIKSVIGSSTNTDRLP